MDNIRIKDHPPWYARGTPVNKTRDGPAMALHDNVLFAICRGPSGEGRGGGGGQGKGRGQGQDRGESRRSEVSSRKSAVGSWQSEDGRWNPDSYRGEDRSRGKPKGKTRRWLTLKTTFFNMQNRVSNQWYGVLGRKLVVFGDADRACPDLSGSRDAVRSEERTTVDFDLSACVAPDNVKMKEDNVNGNGVGFEMVDFDISIVDADRSIVDADSFIVDADSFIVDADRSGDAVRSGEIVDFDLSACVAFRSVGTSSDNVKMMNDNVKLEMEDNVKLKKMDDNVKITMMDEMSNWKRRMNCLTTNFK